MSEEVQTLSPEDLTQIEGDTLLIDVRTHKERAESHIPNSTHISFEEDDNWEDNAQQLLEANPNKNICFYCRSGMRSAKVAHKASKWETGHRLYNLTGGILAWQKLNNS